MIDDKTKELLSQISKSTLEGLYGKDAADSALKYKDIPIGNETYLEFINDFHSLKKEEVFAIINNITDLIICIYRDTKKSKPEIAQRFLKSLVVDYPNQPGTKLLIRFNSLIEAVTAYKTSVEAKDKMLIWQQSKKLIQTYNEFLNGLLGWLIICIQGTLKLKVTPEIFKHPYRKKIEKLHGLTAGLYYLIENITTPQLRNAIAHDTIWFNSEKDLVEYEDRDKRNEIPLENFFGYCYVGSYLPQVYLTALNVVLVIESGDTEAIQKLPEQYINMFFK